MVTCHHCNGAKTVNAFINRGPDISTHSFWGPNIAAAIRAEMEGEGCVTSK